ncbi:hypothetical protein [Aquamicrobium sp. LC103]|uniref:hypothetical protein n=1 Tax=Aquamicrobium sp. LC103 TaxID=1120658 RepID=UPI00063E95EA|nr:hypothetical protein [Aquamicrobium sp. LC103]TKT81274.1 hypothetical protein XW59_005250 [Aquamicrobium sp. LC103]
MPANSEPTAKALEKFLVHQEKYQAAVRRQHVPTANREILKVGAALGQLTATPEGRDILENMLRNPSAYLRLRAAGKVLAWAPDRALPVLGKLLVESLGEETSVDERIGIRVEAEGWLFQHFGIRNFDPDRLIEPMRAYGVELPRRKQWET